MKHKTTKFSLLAGGLFLLLSHLAIAAEIFTPGSQPNGYLSRPAVTLFDLSSGTESYFQLDFRKDTWAGNVLAWDINQYALIQTTGPWDDLDPTLATAASILDATNWDTGRKIATGTGPFRWADLSAADQTAIGSAEILNFVRGDRSNEEPNGLSYHQRESVLGDILHSTFYYWDDGSTQTLYVGANDGMLHAFDATTGAENWAYIPSMVIPNLTKLKEKTYVHTYFVDGPISIDNIEVSGSIKTILVGTLGAGGAGLYAMDISNPAAASETAVADKVLWEITASGSYSDLGYTYAAPQLAKINGTPAVVVGNGYVNSGTGHAVLYVINALSGGLISAIDTLSGSSASPNGLSSPTLYDADGDGEPDYAYAGDIDGNMWKFDLSSNSATLLLATTPAQAITSAPVVRPHPLGGQMVVFATGRILSTGDKVDTSVHYAYGIWDGAPGSNTTLLTQTLTDSTYGSDDVRTVSANTPDWSDGNNKGWKVALKAGERVVGERPFYNNGRFYFRSTNPTVDGGENWLIELTFNTGGSPGAPIFDLNKDSELNDSDLAANGEIPVAKYLGTGIFSQPLLVAGDGFLTTLYASHPDLTIQAPPNPDDPGVSGGHFDYDIYYYSGSTTTTVTTINNGDSLIVNNWCKKPDDADKHLETLYKGCQDSTTGGYDYLTDYTVGACCNHCDETDTNKWEYYLTLSCNTATITTYTTPTYKKVKHVHQYDDKWGVTGVNMLNASDPDFNLINALPDVDTPFKILVMNQYLNPAAHLSVGGADYESVKTYESLASQTDAATLLAGLPVYAQANPPPAAPAGEGYTIKSLNTFIFALPLDAFKSKDWWGDGSQLRAGLIPTQTGCVNSVNALGVQDTPGPNGERFNGALTMQLIKPETPASALELNGPDVTYGWRVKLSSFLDYVLAEYTTFWHHPNKYCYDDAGWIPDPAEDTKAASATPPPPGTGDPTGGSFGTAVTSRTTTVSGNTTTTTSTYSDGTSYIRSETLNADGSTTITQTFRDGTTSTVTVYPGEGGKASFVDPGSGSPLEDLPLLEQGRQSWRDILN